MNIEIIEQTDNYVVLNKPAKLAVHSDGKISEKTLVDFILKNWPQTQGVGENIDTNDGEINRPGIVHRLDKETSGVILVALNQKAYEHFKEQFKEREVQKIYHLFAYGNIKEDEMEIDKPIGKDRKDFRRRTTRNPRGKVRESETHIKVLGRGGSGDGSYVFVEAKPKTGRTHQIRVHMHSVSHPIVADPLYSGRDPILGFERLALHARSLKIKDLDGEDKIFEASYTDDFIEAMLEV
jgi:23S rRNA pseudouridine1911/1915/1917 synthase